MLAAREPGGVENPMTLETLKSAIPDYARDLKLNLGSVLTTQGAPGLTETQIAAVALSSAIASRNAAVTAAIEQHAETVLDQAGLDGARSAAAIMGMNNVYYRFVHLAGDDDYRNLPARLRMNVIGRPGIDKIDFELCSIAVSAVNGCGLCIESHEKMLRAAGLGVDSVHSAVRIASVIHAVAALADYEAGKGENLSRVA